MTTISKFNTQNHRHGNRPKSLIDLMLNDDEFFGSNFLPNDVTSSPQYDIIENDNEYVVQFMLPGFKKENINIDVNDNTLIIEGERKIDENAKYNYKGSFYGKFSRSFTLSDDIAQNKINASFEDGILTIEIPKEKENKSNKKIKIN